MFYLDTEDSRVVLGDNYKAKFLTEDDAKNFVETSNLAIFEQLKQEKIAALRDKYDKVYEAYLSKYPKQEVASFPIKQAEAIAYRLDNTAATPTIDKIAKGRDRVEYINSILAKLDHLADIESELLAKRNAIKACATIEELNAIEI